MSIAQDILDQVESVKAQIKSGELSVQDGTDILNELKDVQAQLKTADAEIAVRYLVEAVSTLASL